MNYANQFVLLASKHQKEDVIAPIFRQKLACHVFVEDIDTDRFGTFTGEIARPLSAYDTCVLKAKQAADETNHVLSMASEGSFGPHPSNPFMAHAHEIMVFVDLQNDWIIADHLLTSQTNYQMMIVAPDTPLTTFLEQALFPSHALTLQSGDRREIIAKGIRHVDELDAAMTLGFKKHPELFIATDMRAMMNPTRMKTLAELAEKLAHRIQTHCPQCNAPGFGFKAYRGHLPCRLCGNDTSIHQFEAWGCVQCDNQIQRPRPDQLTTAEPNHCDVCNP